MKRKKKELSKLRNYFWCFVFHCSRKFYLLGFRMLSKSTTMLLYNTGTKNFSVSHFTFFCVSEAPETEKFLCLYPMPNNIFLLFFGFSPSQSKVVCSKAPTRETHLLRFYLRASVFHGARKVKNKAAYQKMLKLRRSFSSFLTEKNKIKYLKITPDNWTLVNDCNTSDVLYFCFLKL